MCFTAALSKPRAYLLAKYIGQVKFFSKLLYAVWVHMHYTKKEWPINSALSTSNVHLRSGSIVFVLLSSVRSHNVQCTKCLGAFTNAGPQTISFIAFAYWRALLSTVLMHSSCTLLLVLSHMFLLRGCQNLRHTLWQEIINYTETLFRNTNTIPSLSCSTTHHHRKSECASHTALSKSSTYTQKWGRLFCVFSSVVSPGRIFVSPLTLCTVNIRKFIQWLIFFHVFLSVLCRVPGGIYQRRATAEFSVCVLLGSLSIPLMILLFISDRLLAH